MSKITLICLFLQLMIMVSCMDSRKIILEYDGESPAVSYGISKLTRELSSNGYKVLEDKKTDISTIPCIYVISPSSDLTGKSQKILTANSLDALHSDGYQILKEEKDIFILGKTDRGCLYGIKDLQEQIRLNPDLTTIGEGVKKPALSFRAIKFNLPWAPYRPGPASDVHFMTCRDLKYWEAFLDMMVDNRFNALTLWSTHLFPYMIRSVSYPLATPFDDQELNEWKTFWNALFKMAKDRGIETYIVNWNIVVSPEFAKNYNAEIYDDRSAKVINYTRESVTQLINEYEDLTGLGVTLADWMGNWGENQMTPAEREDWIESTFIEGMKNADRKIKFIHRAVLAGDPGEMRRVINNAGLPDKTIVEIKFNWSHGHSTPRLSITHANEQGSIMRDFWDPVPENYFIAWMIRNEDFFVLRWGSPGFIREHIKTNNHNYVDGYFIGSEGYIPAKDYSHVDSPQKTWKYAFEKQWMFYYLWGRLMYDPDEADESLAKIFDIKYKNIESNNLLKAYTLASDVPLKLATFYKGTWDYTLYCEGFLAPNQIGFEDNKSPFISIEELVRHETLDPSYLSIVQYCTSLVENTRIDPELVSPVALASDIQKKCTEALTIIGTLRNTDNDPALDSELDDLETWCYLGFYFADKLRAGIALELYYLSKQDTEKAKALDFLQKCSEHWNEVVRLTENRYKPMPYVSMGQNRPRWPGFTAFHWSLFKKEVDADLDFVRNHE
jgi:hypothetical protein